MQRELLSSKTIFLKRSSGKCGCLGSAHEVLGLLICSLNGSAAVLTSFIGSDVRFRHAALQKLHHFLKGMLTASGMLILYYQLLCCKSLEISKQVLHFSLFECYMVSDECLRTKHLQLEGKELFLLIYFCPLVITKGFPRDDFSFVSVWSCVLPRQESQHRWNRLPTSVSLIFSTLIANPPARSAHPLSSDIAQLPFSTFTTLEELSPGGQGKSDVVMT